jgi:hypothetical protein
VLRNINLWFHGSPQNTPSFLPNTSNVGWVGFYPSRADNEKAIRSLQLETQTGSRGLLRNRRHLASCEILTGRSRGPWRLQLISVS